MGGRQRGVCKQREGCEGEERGRKEGKEKRRERRKAGAKKHINKRERHREDMLRKVYTHHASGRMTLWTWHTHTHMLAFKHIAISALFLYLLCRLVSSRMTKISFFMCKGFVKRKVSFENMKFLSRISSFCKLNWINKIEAEILFRSHCVKVVYDGKDQTKKCTLQQC